MTGAGFAATTSGTTFTGSITLADSQNDSYFVYDANGGSIAGAKPFGGNAAAFGYTHYVPAGTFAVSESIADYITAGTATALGLYTQAPGATQPGVAVAVSQSVFNAAVGKETWNQVFTSTSESTIATALASGDTATLQTFLNQYSSDFLRGCLRSIKWTRADSA